ncbi:MAG: hypothetical protein J3K34DRAFT_412117 [Monoraphidium minutum]|nr:MAG: hypothetical protein J3K34DRAFT_412117 [Monoraphidium minutum]
MHLQQPQEGGVQLSDGDGTVPLLSLGALCEGGWRRRSLNPGGARVVVREYPHEPVFSLTDPRGGPGASTHVEILGHDGVLADLLRIASGAADDAAAAGGGGADEAVPSRYVSAIREIAGQIAWD